MQLKKTILVLLLVTCGAYAHAQVTDPILSPEIRTDDKAVKHFFDGLEASDYASYPENFKSYWAKYKWDDWIFYKVVEEAINAFFPDQSIQFKTLFCWYVLNKSGFDVRLLYLENNFLLFAYTQDNVAGISRFLKDGKRFACLNTLDLLEGKKLSESSLILNGEGMPLSFVITKPPEFPPIDSAAFDTFNSELSFNDSLLFHRQVIFKIKTNNTLIWMFKSYPNLEYAKLFNTPLSREVYDSFIPQLKELVRDADTVDIANFIFHFVRDGFLHLDDYDPDSHGREKWTTPEEALAYPYLDSEDRSALFYYLIKEILNIPLIVINYPDHEHVNVALSLDGYGVKGDFKYKGRSFLVCETSDPKNYFGKDMKYKEWKYEIAVEYFP